MGELSEADKRILLGADYKSVEERSSARLEAAGASGNTGWKGDGVLSAAGFAAFVSLLIFMGDYFRPAANRKASLEIVAIVVFVASALVIAWRMRRSRTRQPTPSS